MLARIKGLRFCIPSFIIKMIVTQKGMMAVMKSWREEGYEIFLWGEETKEPVPVIWCHIFSREEGEKIWSRITEPCVFACVSGRDWNRDFSPWKADKIYGKDTDFSGGAGEYLQYFEHVILPEAEHALSFEVKDRGIVGYSMAGLFAVYAMYHSEKFGRIGSISGSLWFDGWADHALSHTMKAEKPVIYVSLGSREHKVRNARMASVKKNTELLAAHWEKSCPVILESNPGGHFDDPEGRVARGVSRLLTADKAPY